MSALSPSRAALACLALVVGGGCMDMSAGEQWAPAQGVASAPPADPPADAPVKPEPAITGRRVSAYREGRAEGGAARDLLAHTLSALDSGGEVTEEEAAKDSAYAEYDQRAQGVLEAEKAEKAEKADEAMEAMEAMEAEEAEATGVTGVEDGSKEADVPYEAKEAQRASPRQDALYSALGEQQALPEALPEALRLGGLKGKLKAQPKKTSAGEFKPTEAGAPRRGPSPRAPSPPGSTSPPSPPAHSAHSAPYSRDALSAHLPLKEAIEGGRPRAFWPRQGYFENTYVGGDLSLESERAALPPEVARALESSWAGLQAPPLDPPSEGGVALTATLSHPSTQGPRRVLLQVGLKGSERYGWRRPPLSLVAVVDPRWGEGGGGLDLVSALSPILAELSPVDEVGVVCGALRLEPRPPEALREALIALPPAPISDREPLAVSLSAAGELLEAAAANPHRAPGAQEALLLCGAGCIEARVSLEGVAHSLNTSGALTSVIYRHPRGAAPSRARLGGELWRVAEVGHGGYWEAQEGAGGFDDALRDLTRKEFERISRVVARLLRLSVRLAKGVELIEVVGSRMLNQRQAAEVKAREVAMDQRLSARLGIKSDRGEDDEGVQVVIPAFYGGDRHFITLALWVEGPGEVAEVHLKYKDMVRAQNASASAAARLSAEVAALGEINWEVRRVAAQQLDAAALARAAERGDFMLEVGGLRDRLNSLAAERGAGAAAVDEVWGRGGRKAARALSRALVGSAR